MTLLRPDFVMICESFSNKEISDAYLKLDGYELVCRNDGKDTVNGKCRGLLIYALLGLQASRFEIEGAENCTECAGISVPWGGGEEIKLVMVYRPPTKPGSDVDGVNTARLCQSLSSLEGKGISQPTQGRLCYWTCWQTSSGSR